MLAKLQHGGISGGGGMICAFGPSPFFTTKAMSMPHVICRSKWQCINQTPIYSQKNINIIVILMHHHNIIIVGTYEL